MRSRPVTCDALSSSSIYCPPRATCGLTHCCAAELIVAKALDARGQGRELAATLKLQSWQGKNHLTWARRFSMAELVAALEGAVDVELALKGSADSQTALLLWITNILRKS